MKTPPLALKPQAPRNAPRKTSPPIASGLEEKGSKDNVSLSFSDKVKNFVKDSATIAMPILSTAATGAVFASAAVAVAGTGPLGFLLGGSLGLATSAVTGYLMGGATSASTAETSDILMGRGSESSYTDETAKAGAKIGLSWGVAGGFAAIMGMSGPAILGMAGVGAGLAVAAHALESAVTGKFGVPMNDWNKP